MRSAISPRLAMRILPNTSAPAGGGRDPRFHVLGADAEDLADRLVDAFTFPEVPQELGDLRHAALVHQILHGDVGEHVPGDRRRWVPGPGQLVDPAQGEVLARD